MCHPLFGLVDTLKLMLTYPQLTACVMRDEWSKFDLLRRVLVPNVSFLESRMYLPNSYLSIFSDCLLISRSRAVGGRTIQKDLHDDDDDDEAFITIPTTVCPIITLAAAAAVGFAASSTIDDQCCFVIITNQVSIGNTRRCVVCAKNPLFRKNEPSLRFGRNPPCGNYCCWYWYCWY